MRFPNRTIGVNLGIFDNVFRADPCRGFRPYGENKNWDKRFSTQILKKYAETPKQKPQANKPYGIQEVFEVFKVSAEYPVRLHEVSESISVIDGQSIALLQTGGLVVP